MTVKKMKKKHLAHLSVVLTEAFNAWRAENRGKPPRDRMRKVEAMEPYLNLEPDGCFVAINKGKIVGGIFSHVWGKTGWIGTFGILPQYQKKGLGKELLKRAIDYLDNERTVTKLALETQPDCKTNIALYSKLNFRPAFQTISMQKEIFPNDRLLSKIVELTKKFNLEIGYFSSTSNKEDALRRCSWLANKIELGLDHRVEITLTDENNFGDTIFIKRDGFIIGYALCHIFSRYDNQVEDTLTIKSLVLDKDIMEKELLQILLLICEGYGIKNEKSILKLYINSSYWTVYRYLLEQDFTIRGSLLRMIRFSGDIRSFDHSHEWIAYCSAYLM